MKSKITIGKDSNGRNVLIDVQSILIQKVLIAAATGSGKSWLLRLLAEKLNRIVQTIVIDWDGDFATLQSKFDFLIIGKGRNISPRPEHVMKLGEMIHSQGVSVVVDTSEYDYEIGERQKFVADFLNGVYAAADKTRKTRAAHYVQIIVDEAHNFAPEEKISFDNPAYKSRSILRRINSQGRSRWLGLALATQRLAKLDKSSIDGLKNQVLGYFVLENDKKTAAAQLGLGKSEFDLIKNLDDGEFLAYGRMFGHREIFQFKTEEVQTYHATPGKIKSQLVISPSKSIKHIIEKLADLPQQEDARVANEKELRAEIAELKKKLRENKAPSPASTPEKAVIQYKPVHVPVLEDRQLKKLNAAVDRMVGVAAVVKNEMGKLSNVVSEISGEIAKVSAFKMPVAQQAAPPRIQLQKARVEAAKASIRELQSKIVDTLHDPAKQNGKLPVGEKKTLTACLQFPEGLSREKLTVLTGYKRSSRDAYIFRLRERGYVLTDANIVLATNNGENALPEIAPLPIGVELREYWLARLPEGERKVIALLIERYPDKILKEEIDQVTGYKRSSRDAYLYRLAAKNLVAEPESKYARASDILFEE